MLRRGVGKQVESTAEIERKILIGMIVSTKFCRDILPIVSKDYFVAPYAKEVLKWVSIYFKKYEKAPMLHIQDIFEAEKDSLPHERIPLVETFLESLSEEYEKSENFNTDYLFDESIKFFREKGLRNLSGKINGLLDLSRLEDAEEIVRDYEKAAKATSKWENPFENNTIQKTMEENEETFFVLPGRLGQAIGNLERGFFVGIFGPMKRGKSWLLGEIGIVGLLSRKKVAFISAEMSSRKIAQRFYRRLTGLATKEGDYIFPVFDCYKNQTGECSKKQRKNFVNLISKGEELPDFDQGTVYKVCTYCRENKIPGYAPAVWYEIYPKKKMTVAAIQRKMKSIKNMFGENLRIIAYPRFDASMMDVERDIEQLIYTEDFIPDIIITDYADIFKPSKPSLVGRDAIDDIWKLHARMASRRHVIVFTGSQTTRGSLEAKVTKFTDTAEDIRKLAHIDLGLFMSQTWKEKTKGFQRISILNRHEAFDEKKQIQILQQLDIGQVLLDSDWYFKNK